MERNRNDVNQANQYEKGVAEIMMIKEQEIQVKLHLSVSVDAKYDEKELIELVKRNIGFRNKWKYIHSLSFIEERGIYSDEELSKWITIYNKKELDNNEV